MLTETLDLAGNAVHVTTWPGDSGGRRYLVVPGLGGSAADWGPAASHLVAAGSSVTVLDLPGFGRSRLPSGRADLGLFVDVVLAAAEELEPDVAVGNSLGGLTLLLATRGDLRARSLVLGAPALPNPDRSLRAIVGSLSFALAMLPVTGPVVVDGRKRLLGPDRFVRQRLRANLHKPDAVDEETVASLVALSRERLGFKEAGRAYSTATRSIARRYAEGYEAAREVGVPVLVVHGRQDRIVPVGVAGRLAELRPDWDVEVLDACGHLSHLDDPPRFAGVVHRWSDTVLTGTP